MHHFRWLKYLNQRQITENVSCLKNNLKTWKSSAYTAEEFPPTMAVFSWSIFIRTVIDHMTCYNLNWPKIKLWVHHFVFSCALEFSVSKGRPGTNRDGTSRCPFWLWLVTCLKRELRFTKSIPKTKYTNLILNKNKNAPFPLVEISQSNVLFF